MRVTRKIRLFAAVIAVASAVAGAAGAQTITEFPVSAGPYGITLAQDGSLFFTEFGGEKVSRMTTAGVVTNRFAIPLTNPVPLDITTDAAGDIWFTDALKENILKMTPGGTFTFPSPYSVPGGAYGIAAGPDGKMWFTQFTGNRIGRLDPVSGNSTFFNLPSGGSSPTGIVVGPDGNLWFTEKGSNKIGRITTAGVLTEFNVPTAGAGPNDICVGADGALWFTEQTANKIGRVTTSGVFTETAIPGGSGPFAIETGPDQAIWFTEAQGNAVGRIGPTGIVQRFPLATPNASPSGLSPGPDRTMWFTQQNSKKIGRIQIPNGPSILTFTAAPGIPIPSGSPATLTWTSTDGVTALIDQKVGGVFPNGSVQVNPVETTTYTLRVTGLWGVATAQVTVNVIPPPTIPTFTATPSSVSSTGTSTLAWTSTNATSASIDEGVGPVATNGNVDVVPGSSKNYTLTVVGPSGQATRQVTVTVVPAPVVASFTAAPGQIALGASSTLTWNVTGSTTSVSIDGGVGAVATSGSTQVTPATAGLKAYTLTATGLGGTATGTANVNVLPADGNLYSLAPCRIVDTRGPVGPLGGPSLVSGASRDFTIAGNCGVPLDAKAVTLNLTTLYPPVGGSLTVYAKGTTPVPNATAISFDVGTVRANNASLGLGTGGQVTVVSNMPSGTVDLIIDVSGYYR